MGSKFKKIGGAVLTTSALVMSTFSQAKITVPDDFYEIQGGYATQLFSDNSDNYVLFVDISRGAKLKHYFGQKGTSEGSYKRFLVNNSILNYGEYAVVNGGFFNFGGYTDNFFHPRSLDFRRLSFPATPGVSSWGSKGEKTRTLCIKGNEAVVYDTKYSTPNYSNTCSFSLTLLHPDVEKKPDSNIFRTYVGVSKDSSSVLFFVSKNKTQKDMENVMKSWSIPYYNIVMGDGSYSSALSTREYLVGGYRSVPHAVKIIDK